jgi:predicted DCC family thiol-disulfide oxidoreductase YuxK
MGSAGERGGAHATATAGGTLHVVYDRECPVCRAAVAVARATDVRGVLVSHDGTRPDAVAAALPALRGADLDAAIHVVAEDGRVFRGFFAIRRLARSSPWLWPLLPILHLPGAGRLGPRLYAWVARNRRRIRGPRDLP